MHKPQPERSQYQPRGLGAPGPNYAAAAWQDEDPENEVFDAHAGPPQFVWPDEADSDHAAGKSRGRQDR